ncbi:C4b-binding protein alpha chain-like [Clarias gariepinus]|uniref:C4b-binding protein alpha chain-like n=1 Tax=Clarias gariepinus TaxID=13013 RepID=UPI00234CAFC1|nr:C4b-binding protein alpha chain-like [Clarias gariepinus]XP_053338708.1 C4b-binding protein alpha chain-like [Clarias gariepinus]
MLLYMLTFFMLLMTVNVQAKCVRPVVGENRILSGESNEHTFSDGSSVTFKCSPGYVPERSSASRSIICMGTQWNDLQLQCKKRSCGNPGEIFNGKYLFQEGIIFGATITAQCNKGFRLVGQPQRNCRETGWDGRAPVCEVVKCLKPPSIANGMFNPVADSYDYANVITYSCKGGLDLIGTSELSCSDDGTFQPPAPQCLFVSCERPVIPNAIRIEGKSPPYKYKQFVRYQCNKGYRMEGSDFLICTEDGWNPRPPQCTVITCSKPPDIANGQFYPSKLLYEYGQSVTYSCDTGFRLSGISTIVCTDDETFQKSPQCLEVTCDAPNIKNAVIVKRKTSPYRYKMTIQYQCNEGYSMEGSDLLTCKENGWNPPPPKCNIATCSKLPGIKNVQFKPLKEFYEYGETVTYSCEEGFRLQFTSTISCTDDGTFQTSPRCLEVTCDPPNIENADVVGEKAPSYTYNMTIQYQCEEDYTMEGSDLLTCKENGWDPPPPKCNKVTCDEPPTNRICIVENKAKYYEHKSLVQVRCNPGNTEWTYDIICEENGWNPAPSH